MASQGNGKQLLNKERAVNMITVRFFAALREQLSCDELSLPLNNIKNIEQVKQTLIGLHPHWQSHFENVSLLSAVNNDMVDMQSPVKAGDEVAFFPPVTGG